MKVKRLTRDEEHAGSEISDSIEAIFEKIPKHIHVIVKTFNDIIN